MSFYLKIIGSPAAVKDAVTKEQYIPTLLQVAILEFCDNVGLGQSILLETQGHIDSPIGAFGTVKLDISTVAVAPEPQVKPAVPAALPDGVMAEVISEAGDADVAAIKKDLAAGMSIGG